MSQLYLVEVVPTAAVPALETVAAVDHRVTDVGAQVVEVQVTAAGGRIMALVEADGEHVVADALEGLEAEQVGVECERGHQLGQQ
ncbi:MAG: hypothetical protein Q4D96_01860 [Propionibacteriaceae bacterium]|nr:hypothetical protein [Propionibacteriaceae bacterium]